MRRIVLVSVAVALSAGTSLAAGTLEAVLDRMNQEAVSFRQLTARLTKQSYTAVLNDTTQESGTVWLRRAGSSVQMRTEITQPDPRSVGLDGNTGQIYYPKLNTVQIYDLGKNRGLVDQFLLLGFGSSGRDLQKNYDIQLAGEETVEGQKTAHLALTPKSKKTLEQVKKIELWIPDSAGHPIQQKFFQSGGDYFLVTFADIRLNPNLPETAFRIQLPAGAKKDYPQK